MKKNNRSNFIMVLFFFIGLAVLFYPALSNYTNEKLQSKAITKYEELLTKVKKEDYSTYFEEAEEYNTKLMNLSNPLINYGKLGDTKDILNVNGTGMIGYITIDKIRVELPIYQGTKPETLSTSVGLLEGTSFPIGGEGTHAILAAHRGLPSSKLFTDLDEIKIGDTFIITVLDRKFTYEVDQILIVKPTELNTIQIEKDKDYVTLMTCTPYGINTHRLLVRGHRIENAKVHKYITTEAFKVNRLVVTPIVCMPILFIWLLLIAFKPSDKRIDYKTKYVYPTHYKQQLIKKEKELLKSKSKEKKGSIK